MCDTMTKAQWIRDTAKLLMLTAIGKDLDRALICGAKPFIKAAEEMANLTDLDKVSES